MSQDEKSINVPIREVAVTMDMGLNTIYNAAKANSLPFPVVRVGKRFFVPRGPYEQFLATGKPTNEREA